MKIILLLMFIVFLVCGCADVKTPGAQYTLTHPLSTKSMVVPGTSKAEVIERWGEPSDIIDTGYDDMGIKKEEWVPLDSSYRNPTRKGLRIANRLATVDMLELPIQNAEAVK